MNDASLGPVLEKLRQSYLADFHTKLDLLRNTLANQSQDALRLLHKFKGSSGTYGLPLLSKVFGHIEKQAAIHFENGKNFPAPLMDKALNLLDSIAKSQGDGTGSKSPADFENEIQSLLLAFRNGG